MIKSLLPTEVRVINTIYDIRLGSNLTTKKNKTVYQKFFSLHHIGFYSITLRSFKRSSTKIRSKIPGSYESEKLINTTVIDKFHLKCAYVNGSIVKCVREPV